MKKIITLLMASIFLFGISLLGSGRAEAAELNVLVPTERAVYQRNEKNQSDMLVRVKYEAEKNVTAILWASDNKQVSEEVTLTATADDATVYEGTIPGVPAGGWYKLDVQAKDTVDGQGEVYNTIEQIGVGEVFITGGQSNSCNFGGAKTTAQEDMVSAFNPKTDTWQHCEDAQPCISGFSDGNGYGSPWPSAGDELYAALEVPIGFVTTGFGGSTIAELLDKHYAPILDAIESLRPYGYRAFLLHQGEGDSGIGTKKEDYAESLKKLIDQTREDAGYDLTWVIANAAYTPYTSLAAETEILDAQKEACDEQTTFLGPLTDDMDKDSGYRLKKDNLHFNEEGLKEHGRRWAEVIVQKIIPDYSQLQPDPQPTPTPPAQTPEPTVPPAGNSPTPTQPSVPAVTNSPLPTQQTASVKIISNKGKVFKTGIFQYKITADSKGNKKVKVTAISGKNKKSIVIPKKVKYKGSSYQVRSLDKKALKKLKKVKKIKVPASLYKICKSQLKGKKVAIQKY